MQDGEALMAGGFAHEMRNALSSARLLLGALVPIEAAQVGKTLADAIADDLDAMERTLQHADGATVPAALLTQIAQLRERHTMLAEMMDGVTQGVERGLAISREVLTYAEAGSVVPDDEAVEVQYLAARLAREFYPYVQRLNIDVRLPQGTGALTAKEEHVYMILRNLFANAVDALARQSAGERRLILAFEETPECVILSVEDTGIGMSEETQERVFEPFFTTKGRDGTGLGLGLSRKLASVYGGSLVFTSIQGSGTVFKLTLPKRRAAPKG